MIDNFFDSIIDKYLCIPKCAKFDFTDDDSLTTVFSGDDGQNSLVAGANAFSSGK